jgi:hypothetical protein
MDVTPRQGGTRGLVVALAVAAVTILAARLSMPASLLHVIGPPPVPRVFALAVLPVAAAAGVILGRRAARARGRPGGRRLLVAGWAGFAYLAALAPAAILLRVATLGLDLLAAPAQLIVAGLMACLLFFPWAVLPVLAGAVVLEAWTRPASASLLR